MNTHAMGPPISTGLKCGACGFVATPPKDKVYLLYPDKIEYPCPRCGESDWHGVKDGVGP
jgi:hypothetical protein